MVKEETKRALDELRQANKIVDELCKFGEVDITQETAVALEDAVSNEVQAEKKFRRCLFQDIGWSGNRIDEWFNRHD